MWWTELEHDSKKKLTEFISFASKEVNSFTNKWKIDILCFLNDTMNWNDVTLVLEDHFTACLQTLLVQKILDIAVCPCNNTSASYFIASSSLVFWIWLDLDYVCKLGVKASHSL